MLSLSETQVHDRPLNRVNSTNELGRDDWVTALDCAAGRGELWPVLHRLRDPGWKSSRHAFLAMWTVLNLRLMFRHFYAHRRHIKHLPLFIVVRRDRLQIRRTLWTAQQRVGLHMVWAFRFLAQASRARLFQTIAAWRLAAVATVFRQLVAQLLDHGRLLTHLFLQSQDQRDQLCLVQFIQLRHVVAVQYCHIQ